ncbi:MAG: T9SS type A sorting domain-containing protein, partial [Candidatus Hydrothermales bacterium]
IWQTNPQSWGDYDALILSSGLDVNTVAQDNSYGPSMRTYLKDFVQGGGKLFVEGGEIGFDAYFWNPDFGTSVLHINDWDSDNPGTLNLYLPNHPIAKSPNTLPSQISLNFTGQWGVADALKAVQDAYFVYNWSYYPQDGALIVHDINQVVPNVVYLPINILSVSNRTVAKALIENSVEYLLGYTGVYERDVESSFSFLTETFGRNIKVSFILNEAQEVNLKVYDISGRKSCDYKEFLKPGNHSLTLSNFKPGVYFLFFKVKSDLREVRKIVFVD